MCGEMTVRQQVLTNLEKASPDIVVNSAAYIRAGTAESNSAFVMCVDRNGRGLLAELRAVCSLPLVHISTDCVFNGSKPAPCVEHDAVGSVRVYGIFKKAGERKAENGSRSRLSCKPLESTAASARVF
jgi:dTDP-4-dehydrorhamnose reductase